MSNTTVAIMRHILEGHSDDALVEERYGEVRIYDPIEGPVDVVYRPPYARRDRIVTLVKGKGFTYEENGKTIASLMYSGTIIGLWEHRSMIMADFGRGAREFSKALP